MVDPLHIRDTIKALEDEISAFETNADFAIQRANAINEIEIEY